MSRTERRTERHRAAHRAQGLMGWIVSLIIVFALLFLIFELWLVPVRVTGQSMEPSLSDREGVLIDHAAKYWKTPGRGDVVYFQDPSTGSMLLKRIVALPGETVDIAQGRVYIDGRPLEESAYAVNFEQGGDMAATVVPEGKVFVLSDNRAESYDSRSPQIGCVTYEKIEGVLRFRILPTSRIAFYY